jgi:hypothetical protein
MDKLIIELSAHFKGLQNLLGGIKMKWFEILGRSAIFSMAAMALFFKYVEKQLLILGSADWFYFLAVFSLALIYVLFPVIDKAKMGKQDDIERIKSEPLKATKVEGIGVKANDWSR